MSENTNTERDYPELPNFDSGDESIWEAIFNWQTAQPGADAHRKSLAVEAAIISTLHAYVDEDRKARASLSPPAAGQEPIYAFRRKGLRDFCTCDADRYAELSTKPNLFEVQVFYAAPQPAVAAGWVPIETAPKDTLILLYGAKRLKFAVGMHHSRDGWVSDSTSEFLSMYPPTHWMHIPPAPSTEGERDANA